MNREDQDTSDPQDHQDSQEASRQWLEQIASTGLLLHFQSLLSPNLVSSILNIHTQKSASLQTWLAVVFQSAFFFIVFLVTNPFYFMSLKVASSSSLLPFYSFSLVIIPCPHIWVIPAPWLKIFYIFSLCSFSALYIINHTGKHFYWNEVFRPLFLCPVTGNQENRKGYKSVFRIEGCVANIRSPEKECWRISLLTLPSCLFLSVILLTHKTFFVHPWLLNETVVKIQPDRSLALHVTQRYSHWKKQINYKSFFQLLNKLKKEL